MTRSLIERVLDRLFEYQEIYDGCEADTPRPGQSVYLKRYYILRANDPNHSAGIPSSPRRTLTLKRKSDGFQIYLHKICRSDADRELHDHPWDFVSLILWRGYREEIDLLEGVEGRELVDHVLRIQRTSRKWPGMILVRRAEHRHRVLVGKPAWTLVFTSKKRRTWGFWPWSGFVPWRTFIARKCEAEAANG